MQNLLRAFAALGIRIEAPVGSGGSGDVYRAVLEESGTRLAIKTCRDGAPGTPGDLAFRLEFDRHVRLRHEHILAVHDFGEIDGGPLYYTMEWVDAVPLDQVYARGGLRALGEVTLAISQALEYAHERGIVHGDLKPSNILVAMAADGTLQRVALADFGNARDRGTRSGEIWGTAAYWSPELLLGWPADARSDLWALGVTLFELVSGRRLAGGSGEPGPGGDPLAARSRWEGVTDVDPDWAALVDSLLSPDPSRRPAGRESIRRVARLTGRTVRDAPDAPPPAFLDPSPAYVGHTEALDRILAEGATGSTVLLLGEAGVGKTRLLDEVARKAQRRGMQIVRSDAQDGGDLPFRLFRRVRRGGAVFDLLSGLPAAAAGTLAASGAHETRLGMILDALLKMAEAPGRERVFLFDSVDLADTDSLDVIEGLQERLRTGGGRIVVAVDAAEDSGTARLRTAGAVVIPIPPLSSPELRELTVSLLAFGGGAHLAPVDELQMDALLRWLERESGGVPASVQLRLEELIRLGVLSRRDDSTWDLDDARLPSVHGPVDLSARAREIHAAFDGPQRNLLELAVLLGVRFDATRLAQIEAGGGGDCAAFVAHGLRRGLLGETPGGSPHFRFRSADLHRALEACVPAKRRRELHARIAAVLARAPDTPPLDLARHLQRSGNALAAGRALADAADVALRHGASHEAARLYQAAWDATPDEVRRDLVPFAPAWMHSLFMVGRMNDGIRIATAILAAVPPLPALATRDRLRVEAQLAHCSLIEGKIEDAERTLNRLVTTPELEGFLDLAAYAWMDLGHCLMVRGDFADAHSVLEKAHSIARASEDRTVLGLVEIQRGHLSWRRNELHRALEWHRSAERHLADADARDFLPSAWGHQAVCLWYLLEPAAAAALHRQAAEAYTVRNRRSEAARSFQNLAPILTELGRWREADEALVAADRLHRVHRSARQTSFFEYASARLAMYRGDFDEAMRRILHAIELADETHDDLVVIGHQTLRGLIEWEARRVDEAAATATQVLERSETSGDGWGLAKGLFLLGASRHAQGRLPEAREALARGADVAEKRTQPVAAFRIELARAGLHGAEGELPEANAALERARDLAVRSASTLWGGLLHHCETGVRFAEGRLDDALAAAARAYEIFAGLGAERWRADTLLLQSRLWSRVGQDAAARSASGVARDTYRTLGLTPPPAVPGIDDDSYAEVSLRILDTVSALSRRLVSPGTVDHVLERILDAANAYFGTERGVIALYRPGTRELETRCRRVLDEASLRDGLAISLTSIDTVRNTGRVVFSNDALEDPTLNQRESVRRLRIRSLAAVPLLWQGRIRGVLYVDHRSVPGLFRREARKLLDYFADIAAAAIHRADRLEIQEEGARRLRAAVEEDDLAFPGTVARDGGMRSRLRRGLEAARRDETILLTGETGCGKNHIARLLHGARERKGAFVTCSLLSLTDSLFSAEVFGVAPGTATSVQGRAGYIEKAMGGTLLLDEIGDLTPENQSKLLAFLERREFCRVGSTDKRVFDGLILGATNVDLKQKLAEGRLRPDFYYRLNDCALPIPPLRERREDIPELAAMFLRQHADSIGCDAPVLRGDAIRNLLERPWNGNIRELRSVLVHAAKEAGHGSMICPVHLDLPDPPERSASPWANTVQEAEIRLITDELTRSGGNVRAAARSMKMTESRLRRRIKRLKLEHLMSRPPKDRGE